MNREGFVLLDVIIALFIIGLIVVTFFPIYASIDRSFKRSEEITEMTYLAETVIETLRSQKDSSLEFLEELGKARELNYENLEKEDYVSIVSLLNSTPHLWEIDIIVRKKSEEGGNDYVQIEAAIPKP